MLENLGKYLPLRCRVGDMGFVELQRTFEIAVHESGGCRTAAETKIVRVFDCRSEIRLLIWKIMRRNLRRGDLFEEIYLRLERNVAGFEIAGGLSRGNSVVAPAFVNSSARPIPVYCWGCASGLRLCVQRQRNASYRRIGFGQCDEIRGIVCREVCRQFLASRSALYSFALINNRRL